MKRAPRNVEPNVIHMRFDTRQNMQLGQQMKLGPRMIQSMEILQLPLPLLQERIDQELESNVALEQVLSDNDSDAVAGSETDGAELEREFVAGEGAEDFNRLDDMERRTGETWNGEDYVDRGSMTRGSGDPDRKLEAMANTAGHGESLAEQLQTQWRMVEATPAIQIAGQRLIEYVDDDGLLGADLETILEQLQADPGSVEFTWTMELLEEALGMVQQELEPAGLMGRNRRETLLLQINNLAAQGGEDAEVWSDCRKLIDGHFEDLVENRLPKIAREAELDLDRVQQAKDQMRRLSLWPGRELVNRDSAPIIPDVVVDYDPESDLYEAHMPRRGGLPSLRISPQYEEMTKDTDIDKEAREFVGKSVRDATWLIDAINQRSSTLLRVVAVVLSRQRDFLDHGPQHLKPLPMTEVADQLGIHVATVSRAVAEKWIQTPRGVYPLRRFFSGGLETEEGGDRSWEAIKEVMREMIDGEDKARPLSDQAISDLLAEKGLKIARRTVVKYREQLGIPPARRRKIHG